MSPAFWDASALVPLCVQQRASPIAARLVKQHEVVVWWATAVEVKGAFTRLLRMKQLTPPDYVVAENQLDRLRNSWSEVAPAALLRTQAEILLDRFPLKAADALQLAAALTWTEARPQGRVFISGDAQLLEAARQLGFRAVEA